MKPLFIPAIYISFFICCSTFVSAQIEKGNYILGGSAGIENISSSFGNASRYNVTTINIHPMYGSFISDRFLIGTSVNLTYDNIGKGYYIVKAGPIIRYYFNNIFLQSDYSFGIPATGYFEHDIYVRLGYAYFINESIAIEPYVFVGLRDQVLRSGNINFRYLDDGIYFSIQVYLESVINKSLKMHKVILKRKE